MSLHQLANHMSAQGRGPDSTLVHMSPREVSGLQSLAMAHGGTLTVNPQTGLPEAGFLDSLLPTLIGGAATYFTGGAINPAVIAAAVGGITALTSKDLGKGLMAGLGAYGGGSIVSGLAGLGTGAMSAEAGGAAVQAAGVNPFGLEADMLSQSAVAPKLANASYYDKLAAGASKAMSNPGDALSAFGDGNKFMGAAKLAGPAMAAFSAVDEPKTSIPEKSKTAFIRSFYKDPVTGQKMANPVIPAEDFGNRTLGEQYFAANGGLIALAGGGQTAYDYLDRKRSTSSDAGTVVDDTPPKPRLPPLGSDGKGSYTYNKDSKTWVWTPTAKPVVPVNSGVATLMDTGGPGGGQDRANPSGSGALPGYGAYQNQGSLAAFLSNMGLTSAGQAVATNLGNQLNPGLTLTGADISGGQFTAPETSPNPNTGLQGQGTEGQTGLYGDAAATVKSFDPYAGDSAKDAGRAAALAESRLSVAELNKISDDKFIKNINELSNLAASNRATNAAIGLLGVDPQTGLAPGELGGRTAPIGEVPSLPLDNLGDRPQSNPTASLPTVGYTGTGLSLLSDFLTGSPTSLTTAPVETREATLSPAAAAAASDAAQAAKDNADNPTNDNPSGGDVTSSTPSSGVDTNAGEGGVGGFGGGDSGSSSSSDGSGWAYGGMTGRYAQGGLGSLGGYSDGGRLLRGPGDGVSDSIPATVGGRQPARLADGEFVVPARIVSELGNGSTEAGARALYKMMDRIQANRRKTTGKNRVAVNSKSHKYLPA